MASEILCIKWWLSGHFTRMFLQFWIDAKMESWIFIRLNANALICLFSEHVSSYLVDQVGDITNLA